MQEEEHILVLARINDETSEKLFLKDIDLDKEMWNGKTLRDSEGKEISGIEDVAYMKEFKSYLNRLVKGVDIKEPNIFRNKYLFKNR